jgi:hypothetical protein
MPRTTISSMSTGWYVKEATVGRALVMKRFHTRGRGRSARIEKYFQHLTVVVRERAGRRPPDGSKGQSDRAAARHQPHLGQPLVRLIRTTRKLLHRGSEAARRIPAPKLQPGGVARVVIERAGEEAAVTITRRAPAS